MQAEARARHSYNAVGIGIKGGLSLPNYHYIGYGDLNALDADTLWRNRIRPVGGLTVEIPMSDHFYVSPELLYAQRGDARLFFNVPSQKLIRYVAKINYLDFRLPFSYVIPIKGPLKPYVFAGVEFCLVMPTIHLDSLPPLLHDSIDINLSGSFVQDEIEVEVNNANMFPFDLGLFGGVGARYTLEFARFALVLKLEASYSVGLLNTYSVLERESGVPAANLGTGGTHYSLGQRYNRGIECLFSVVLPLKFRPGDACSHWSNEVYHTSKRGHKSF